MKTRLLLPNSLLAGFLMLMLFASAMPLSRTAAPALAQGPAVDVSGQVFAGSATVPYTYVWVAPVLPGGALDYNNSQYTFTDSTGNFTFTNMPAGNYSLDIDPYCVSDALPLNGYTFSVPGTSAPVNLGHISLPVAPKHIQGTVSRSGVAVPNAMVGAFNSETWTNACAQTDGSGQFSLGVGGGDWEVSVDPQPGQLWMFTQAPPVVHFTSDGNPQTIPINLTVQPTDGLLQGRVLDPNGQPLALPPGQTGPINSSASIDVWNDADNSYNYVYLNSDGTFSLPVVSGRYEVSVWLSTSNYPDYAGPTDVLIETGAGALTLPDLTLVKRDTWIVGQVADNQIPPQPIAGADVQAFQPGGAFAYDQTDVNGNYQLHVPAGDWNVNVFPPQGRGDFLDNGNYQVIATTPATTQTLSFTLSAAAAIINGTLVDRQNPSLVLTDVDAWAYARLPDSQDFVSVQRVTHGGFSLNVPSGALRVGVFLAPGSPYSFTDEITSTLSLAGAPSIDHSLSTAERAELDVSAYEHSLVVRAAGAGPAALLRDVQIPLALNDAHIVGQLIDQQTKQPLTGVTGVVVASPAGANATWQSTDLRSSDGSYDLPLTAGTWYLDYYLDGEQYDSSFATSIQVTVTSGGTVTQNLTTVALDGVIEGTVRDADGLTILPGAYVWVRGTNFEQYTLTDNAGNFQVYVPLHDSAGIARYTVGTAFACDAGSACRLDAVPQTLDAASRTALGALGIAPQGISLNAQRNGSVVTLSGKVTDKNKQAAPRVHVSFVVPNVGPTGEDDADSNGIYSMDVTFGDNQKRVRYNIKAGYVSGRTYTPVDQVLLKQLEVPARSMSAGVQGQAAIPVAGPDLELGEPVTLPEGGTFLFNVADGWSYTLSDGSQIQIPASAVKVSSDETQVRAVVEPAPLLPPTALYDQATFYGYTITLYEASSGKEITQPLLADALLTLRYDENVLTRRRTPESHIRPASFSSNIWQPTDKFVVNTAANKVTVQTRTLGSWALVRPQISSEIYFPIARH